VSVNQSHGVVVRTKSQAVGLVLAGVAGSMALVVIALSPAPGGASRHSSSGSSLAGFLLAAAVLAGTVRLARCAAIVRSDTLLVRNPLRTGSPGLVWNCRIPGRETWALAQCLHRLLPRWITGCHLADPRPGTPRYKIRTRTRGRAHCAARRSDAQRAGTRATVELTGRCGDVELNRPGVGGSC
jgi:hypothetical protein